VIPPQRVAEGSGPAPEQPLRATPSREPQSTAPLQQRERPLSSGPA
jgi:hypothetical protein